MKKQLRAWLVALATVFALVGSIALPFGASAHEHRTVATDYDFVVGFVSEPAIQGELNGVSLEVMKGDKPVTGLDQTLKVEVSVAGQKKEFALSPVWKQDGSYEAFFIPTQPGDYTFRIFGTIEGKEINETFTSSPDGFDAVAPRSDYEFPAVGTPAS